MLYYSEDDMESGDSRMVEQLKNGEACIVGQADPDILRRCNTMPKTQYGVYVASWTFEGWLRDSITDSLEGIRDYILRNRPMIRRVDPDFDVLHYIPDQEGPFRICDRELTDDERAFIFGQ